MDSSRIGTLWDDFSRGDSSAQTRLLSLYYDELRAMARRTLRRDTVACHLQPTPLAHEALLRVLRSNRVRQPDRAHFLALAANVMRRVLVDEVRKYRMAQRQSPSTVTVWLDPETQSLPVDVEAIDAGLSQLDTGADERARIVELHLFAGLSAEDIALELDSAPSAVKRHWQAAQAWLLANLTSSAA